MISFFIMKPVIILPWHAYSSGVFLPCLLCFVVPSLSSRCLPFQMALLAYSVASSFSNFLPGYSSSSSSSSPLSLSFSLRRRSIFFLFFLSCSFLLSSPPVLLECLGESSKIFSFYFQTSSRSLKSFLLKDLLHTGIHRCKDNRLSLPFFFVLSFSSLSLLFCSPSFSILDCFLLSLSLCLIRRKQA